MNPIYLGVNVDHVATLRQARGTRYPDPLYLAQCAEKAGADGITIHLREDRRHIQDHDVARIKSSIDTRLNLEMALSDEMLNIALKTKPAYVCLVPEKREELTTEGGLDVCKNLDAVKDGVTKLQNEDIKVSLFIDAETDQIDAARDSGATLVEIHTGHYADATSQSEQDREFEKIKHAANYAYSQGLIVNAGHGLHYHNVQAIAAIPCIFELNIGHAIIARALIDGMETAVRDMKQLMLDARLLSTTN